MRTLLTIVFLTALAALTAGEELRLENATAAVAIDSATGGWSLLDKRSAKGWPAEGNASAGACAAFSRGFAKAEQPAANTVRLSTDAGAGVTFALGEQGLEITYQGNGLGDVRALGDVLTMTDKEGGYIVVPCREGLLIPADGGKAFTRTFGTSEYEGCHMNMLGLVKGGSALIVAWDDACVFPEIASTLVQGQPYAQRLTVTLLLRRPAARVWLMPLGAGDWNTIAAAYRRFAEMRGLAVTLREKIARNAHLERMLGAADVKLWTCLERRMSEDGTREESVKVNWTFDEAARIAEHIRNDLELERVFFMVGGWTESGYDCRHPDNLPANPECGGNAKLADAIARIQALGYTASLHDNYQDMYRDARSWDPKYIEKRADGSLITGGRWLGGRAYMVCAPMQLELAKRPQNLPGIRALFPAWSYFIDTTYAVGPRECQDPAHPIGRNEDIAWKIRLSDYAREVFGLFGSECGREWALPHSDFFEGLVGVDGKYFHQLDPAALGAVVIPFWEMVYRDCQIVFGKYGYDADKAAAHVAHHVLCGRPLYYHSIPEHLYWEKKQEKRATAAPRDPAAAYTRCDRGWADGLHPIDVFLKNTHEILGPLHEATALDVLTRFEFLTPDRTLRRSVFGKDAARVTVNYGANDVEVAAAAGEKFVLGQWGFLVESPSFVAYFAKRFGDIDYGDGALFTLRALDGKPLAESARIRVFHGFGDPRVRVRGKVVEVPREQTITPAP